MTPPASVSPAPAPEEFRAEIDAVLVGFLEDKRGQLADLHPASAVLADEVLRLARSGGKRLRPALGYWGYRAAGGVPDGKIMRAAASLELFHTFALIHDDLMDDADERRGVPSVHAHMASGADGLDAQSARSAAILVGDLAAVWADELLVTSGFDAVRVTRALARAYAVRRDMAAGQFLDIAGHAGADPGAGRLAADLKGGKYTVTGPLLLGADLATEHPVEPNLAHRLAAIGDPLGEAFQLLDDLHDGDSTHGATRETVDGLLNRASAALDGAGLEAAVAAALRDIVRTVAG